jgi:D-glycero-alpha-D-manno-heptose-7-phosphate kinase
MSFDIKKFIVNENLPLKSALLQMEENSFGMVMAENDKRKIVGLLTDGDIRRSLINGYTLDSNISKCANKEFVSASVNTSREHLIKMLDGHIQFIPVFDKFGSLNSIVSKDYLPLDKEKSTYIRARAPVRMSFGGGGSDLTHYFLNKDGAVINTTISIYSHATMRVREDTKIKIISSDLNASLIANNLEDALLQDGPFGLIQAILQAVKPEYGFELLLDSDFPVGSGLGGSATVSAVVLGCFNMMRKDRWSQHEIAEIAFQAERLHLGISGGWQDQYAAVFGGFNFIEFNKGENIVSPLRINTDIALELEESLILCDTGLGHSSGTIHDDQKHTMSSDSVQNMVTANVELSYLIRNNLLKGDFHKFGECLDKTWKLKRNFSSKISNDYLDSIYDGAIDNGAVGGKLLGAGGGGFFIFYVSPFKKQQLISYLSAKNITCRPFRFEPEGLKAWVSRAKKDI